MARQKPLSRPARWWAAATHAREAIDGLQSSLDDLGTALEELRDVQAEYQYWLDNLPENLQGSAVSEKLETVTDLDLDIDVSDLLSEVDNVIGEAEGIDLPLGFGRD